MTGNNNTIVSYNSQIHDKRINPANAFTFVSFSDTKDLTFVDLSAENAQYRENPAYCRGFHVNTAGTIVIIPPGNINDQSQVSLTVTAGNSYDYSVKRFKLTGTTFSGPVGDWNDHIVAWR